MSKGSGDFSIGSALWPGTSKLIEEMGELQQVLGKLIATAGDTEHWSGDLRPKLIEEIGDVKAAISFFCEMNMTRDEFEEINQRPQEEVATVSEVAVGAKMTPNEVDIDGYFDERKQVRYIGKATHISGNSYRCLAVVGGALCVVEVTITEQRR